MYHKKEPTVLFHTLHHVFKRQVAEEKRLRQVEDLNSPMLLMALSYADSQGQRLSQRELARRLNLSPATVAVSLKTMERNGYVCREVDGTDQRRNLVSITEEGKRAMELCHQAFRAADQRLLADFSAEEKEQLTGYFIRMLRNLGVTNPEQERPPFPPPPELVEEEATDKECECQ